jgi:hypothetical protein
MRGRSAAPESKVFELAARGNGIENVLILFYIKSIVAIRSMALF